MKLERKDYFQIFFGSAIGVIIAGLLCYRYDSWVYCLLAFPIGVIACNPRKACQAFREIDKDFFTSEITFSKSRYPGLYKWAGEALFMGTVILIFCLFITPVLLGVGALSALLHHLGEPPSGFGEALVLSFYFLIASGFVAFLGKIARDFASVFTSKILLPFTCLIFKGEEKGGKGVENILTYHLSFLDTWMEFKKGISISKRELWSAIRLVSFLFIAPTLVILVGTLAVSGLVIFACILAVDVIITIMLGLAINKSLAAGVGGLAGVSLMVFSYPEPNTFAFILFPILGGLIGIGFRRLRVWLEDVQPMPEPVTA